MKTPLLKYNLLNQIFRLKYSYSVIASLAKQSFFIFILLSFLVNTLGPIPTAQAQEFKLPAPGVMVHLSPPLEPPILKGIKVYPDNPFQFDFILDKGDSLAQPMSSPNASVGDPQQEQLKTEATKLIKYFLASLTIPEKDLWVNLSPYEKDRIIPNSFGLTEMGRDLLAEDYMLKQITASLIYPEDGIGKKFWKRIYEEAAKKYGTTNIPVNTFNKVWIIPQKAVVYENAKAGTAYVVESKLKVMLEQDYLSLNKHMPTRGHVDEGNVSPSALPSETGLNVKAPQGNSDSTSENVNALGSQIVREIVIPELTKEVNENKNFAKLRQVYNSLILATWYKKKIKDSIFSQVYSDRNKVAGINIDDPKEKEKIYQRYLQAFKKGVYNYIKEDIDPATQEIIPRKYFSGGVQLWLPGFTGETGIGSKERTETNFKEINFGITNDRQRVISLSPDREVVVKTGIEDEGGRLKSDFAMRTNKPEMQSPMTPQQVLDTFKAMQQQPQIDFHSDDNGQDYKIQVLVDPTDEYGLAKVEVQYRNKGILVGSSYMTVDLKQTAQTVIKSQSTVITVKAHRGAGLKTWLNERLHSLLPGVWFETSIENHQTLLGIHRLLVQKVRSGQLFDQMEALNKKYENINRETGDFIDSSDYEAITQNIYQAYQEKYVLSSDELGNIDPVGGLGRTLGPYQEIRPEKINDSTFYIKHFIRIGRTTATDQAMNSNQLNLPIPIESKLMSSEIPEAQRVVKELSEHVNYLNKLRGSGAFTIQQYIPVDYRDKVTSEVLPADIQGGHAMWLMLKGLFQSDIFMNHYPITGLNPNKKVCSKDDAHLLIEEFFRRGWITDKDDERQKLGQYENEIDEFLNSFNGLNYNNKGARNIDHSKIQSFKRDLKKSEQAYNDYYGKTGFVYSVLSRVLGQVMAENFPSFYSGVNQLSDTFQIKELEEGFYIDLENQFHLKVKGEGETVRVIDSSEENIQEDFQNNPELLVKIFQWAAEHNAIISDRVLHSIATQTSALKEPTASMREAFLQLIKTKSNISLLILKMYQVGLLGKFLPEFEDLRYHFEVPSHRFSVPMHSIYLLYFLENVLPNDARLNQAHEVYRNVLNTLDGGNLLATLRFAILSHDAEKESGRANWSTPHPIGGAIFLTPRFLSQFLGMKSLLPNVQWLVWYHQEWGMRAANTRYAGTPVLKGEFSKLGINDVEKLFNDLRGNNYMDNHDIILREFNNKVKTPSDLKLNPDFEDYREKIYNILNNSKGRDFYFTDLVDTVELGKGVLNQDLLNVFYLLTVADANSVDPYSDSAAKYFDNGGHQVITNIFLKLSEYLAKSGNFREQEDMFEGWKQEAAIEDKEIKESTKNYLINTFKVNQFLFKRQLEGVGNTFSRYKDDIMSWVSKAIIGPDVLLDDFIQMYPPFYFRTLKGKDLLIQQFMLFVLMHNIPKDYLESHALVFSANTAQGPMFEILVGTNKDAEGIMYKTMGVLAAMGFNALDAKINITPKGVSFDRINGYFMGSQNPEAMGKELLGKLQEIDKRQENQELRQLMPLLQEKGLNWQQLLPILINLVMKGIITIDDIFEFNGANQKFEILLDAQQPRTKVIFENDILLQGKPVSVLELKTTDRNGLLYIVSRLFSKRFGLNIGNSPISTLQTGTADKFIVTKNGKNLSDEEKQEIQEFLEVLLEIKVINHKDFKKALTKVPASQVTSAQAWVDALGVPLGDKTSKAIMLAEQLIDPSQPWPYQYEKSQIAQGDNFANLKLVSLKKFVGIIDSAMTAPIIQKQEHQRLESPLIDQAMGARLARDIAILDVPVEGIGYMFSSSNSPKKVGEGLLFDHEYIYSVEMKKKGGDIKLGDIVFKAFVDPSPLGPKLRLEIVRLISALKNKDKTDPLADKLTSHAFEGFFNRVGSYVFANQRGLLTTGNRIIFTQLTGKAPPVGEQEYYVLKVFDNTRNDVAMKTELEGLASQVQNELNLHYDSAGQWFLPYAGLQPDQLKLIMREAFLHRTYGQQDAFPFEQKDVNEHDLLVRGMDQVMSSGEKNIVVTSIGPGEKLEEPLNVLRVALERLSSEDNRGEGYTVAVRVYDRSASSLSEHQVQLPLEINKVLREFPKFQGRVKTEVYYGDITQGHAEDIRSWEAMMMPSNFIVWRNTWVMDQGLTIDDVRAFADVLEKKIRGENQKGAGALIVREYNPRETTDIKNPLRHGLIQRIYRPDGSIEDLRDTAMKGGIDLTPGKMNLQTRVIDSRFRGNDSREGGNDNGKLGDDKGISFHMDAAMLQKLQNAPGFVPVIINVQPLKSLTEFLGLNIGPADKPSQEILVKA